MKVIIVEGPAGLGKSLTIDNLLDKIDKESDGKAFVKYVRCQLPEQKSDIMTIKKPYVSLIDELKADAEDEEFDYVIIEGFIENAIVHVPSLRAELQEFSDKVLARDFISALGEDNVLYVQLAASPKWAYSTDGSMTEAEKEEEAKLYDEAFEQAPYKHKNKVHVEQNNGWKVNFRVLDEALGGFEL